MTSTRAETGAASGPGPGGSPGDGDLLVTGIGSLVTNASGRPGELGIVDDAAVVCRDGRVGWVGRRRDLPAGSGDLPTLDCEGRAAIPGFVDAHTHLVFAGDRADEFALRLHGASYEELLAADGGILSTVRATRAADADELVAVAAARAWRMLAAGTTTVEVKSGYGLDVVTERRMLEVARRLGEELPLDVVPTFLGAHVAPPELSRDAYLDLVCGPMLEACAPHARFCDVFCDETAFTVEEARRVLGAGRARGLQPRVHADQLARVGAARLAAEVGAVSADHLDHATDADLAALRAAGTVAVLLPGVSLCMGVAYPDGRRVWDAGVTVALATDCNPGTAWVETMPFVVALASLEMGLTVEEAVWAATRGGALAVAEPGKGQLVPGAAADLVVLDASSPVHLAYRPDGRLVRVVVKAGRPVPAQRQGSPPAG